MVTIATVRSGKDGHHVIVDEGLSKTSTYGPYKFNWMARLVAWFWDGDH